MDIPRLKNRSSPIILLIGPPGSGKGTQAPFLSKKLGVPHISAGDLFRENLQKGTKIGKKAQEFIKEGNLVPDELVLDLVFSRIEEKDCEKGCILDGFPRNLKQAEALEIRFTSPKIIALELQVPFSLLLERITGRLICASCKSCFHKKYAPSEKGEKCASCEGDLYQREDDKEEVLKRRLSVYTEETSPLLSFYQNKGFLYKVNATSSFQEVFEEALHIIEPLIALQKEEALF